MIITNLNLQEVKFKTWKFPGGEIGVKIDKSTLKTSQIIITTRLSNSDDIMTLLMATDALKRLGIKQFTLIITYLAYARQDRVMVDGESLSLKVMADLINSQNYDLVVVYDPHSNVSEAVLNNMKVFDNFDLFEIFIKANKGSDYTLISPDAGASKKIYQLAKQAGYTDDIIIANKHRDVSTGEITHTSVECGPSYLVGQHCVIVDDICDGGKTFLELAKVLKDKGAKEVTLVVTHGIFSKGFEELGKYIDNIYTTTSFRDIPLEEYEGKCNVTIHDIFASA